MEKLVSSEACDNVKLCNDKVVLKNSGLEYSAEERDKMIEEYSRTMFYSLLPRTVVKGKIIDKMDKSVIVNIDSKADGVVLKSEFDKNKELNIGDSIDVFVTDIENNKGMLTLSRREAEREKTWKMIFDSEQNGTILSAIVVDGTKGGLKAKIDSVDVFIPGSQIDINQVTDFSEYIGQHIDVIVLKTSRGQKWSNNRNDKDSVIVSHKLAIENHINDQNRAILEQLSEGQVIEGVVKNLTSYGAFINIGGVDGLLYINDISWRRINHPNEVLEVGQNVNVVVLGYNKDENRLSLGMKQLEPNPWDKLPTDIVVGSVVEGTVVNITDYGVFLEILPGLEGLIHVSEMSWTQQYNKVNNNIHIGDKLQAKVLELSVKTRRLALGLKQLQKNPWEQKDIDKTLAIGTRHDVKVVNIMSYGCIVRFDCEVEGLLHISDMSWTHRLNNPSDMLAVGDTIEVTILDLNIEEHKINVGLKQLKENPWTEFGDEFKVGTVHEGEIIKKENKGIYVSIEHDMECFVAKSNIPTNISTDIGSSIKIKICEFLPLEFKLFGVHESINVSGKHSDSKSVSTGNKGTHSNKRWSHVNKAVTKIGDIEEFKNIKTLSHKND